MDSQLFEELYHHYKPLIFNYLYRSTFNYHKAEELTQDTFLKVFNSIRKFRFESSLKTWLFAIARNTYLDNATRKQNLGEAVDLLKDQISDGSDDYSSVAEKILIRKVLLKLSEKDRTLILLRDYYAFKYREISKVLGITEGQVKIGLHRARQKFKEFYLVESEVKQPL